MATSVILYLEKKNLNSRIWKATGSDPLFVETSQPQTLKRISLSGGQREDSRGTMSSSGSGNNQCNVQSVQYDLQNSKDPATSDKASEDLGILSQFHRDSNSSEYLVENTSLCAARPSVEAPSPHFQFDVSSGDGIQLFVDLNSTPSDWIESLKDGVHICSNIQMLESPNYHHEIGWRCFCEKMKGSSHVDSFKVVDNGDIEEGSRPFTTGVGALPEFNELNGAEGFLSSPRCNPGNTASRLGNFGEEQATTSSRPESDVEKQVCCAKFCIREGLSPSPLREIREISSNTYDQDRVGVCQDFACQPKSNGTEHCGLINSVACTEVQAFEVADQTKSASTSGLVNGHSSDPTDVNLVRVEIENNKASTSDYPLMLCSHKAVEIRSSLDDVRRNEALLLSCSNSASPSFVAPEKNGVGHCTPPDSDDFDKDVLKSRSTSMEILGRVVAGGQRNKAECLDFRDLMTDTWTNSSGSESSCKRKWQMNGTEGQSQSDKTDAKITRITRQFATKIHDSRRKSSRLFTKVDSI